MTEALDTMIIEAWSLMVANWEAGHVPSPSGDDLARAAHEIDPSLPTDEKSTDLLWDIENQGGEPFEVLANWRAALGGTS